METQDLWLVALWIAFTCGMSACVITAGATIRQIFSEEPVIDIDPENTNDAPIRAWEFYALDPFAPFEMNRWIY